MGRTNAEKNIFWRIKLFWTEYFKTTFLKIIEIIKKCVFFCIKWRYLIALIVFIFCVIFKIHGSSIAEYNLMFENSSEYNSESIILGESRSIRSDEWLVNVPYYMSQEYNDFNKDNTYVSIDGQDMLISGNGPVLDVTILAKPFMWGYVLFGGEYGLSWYWCLKVITLFLVSFEFCMIITRKNKKVSIIGMFMISLAPAIQWWSILDVHIYGMILLVLGYNFFTANKKLYKYIYTIALPLIVVSFILILYPAFIIPTGMFMVVLLIILLIRDKNKITFKKIDIFKMIFMIYIVVGILIYTYITSKDAIVAMMNTAYPGSVTALGGNNTLKDLFTDLASFTLPFKDITYLNNCEISTFIHFAPVFLMLFPIMYKKAKYDKNIIVGKTLVICLVITMVFMLAGFPETLAKITLFSYITRMKITYGFVATIFTIWSIDLIWRKKILTRKNILVVLAIFAVLYICFIGQNELSYLPWWVYGIEIIGFSILCYVILMGYKKISTIGIILLMIISGATINPVMRGASALFEHPLEKKISEITDNDNNNYWMTVGDEEKLNGIGLVNGAKVINAVNYYPDYGKWGIIDPDKKYEEYYNRFAHIRISLTKKETEFDLIQNDVVEVKLNCDDALNLPVKYLLTLGELNECSNNYEKIYDDTEGQYYIYERKEK